ncbi:Cof-type HAD-IIB family hydrolase [Brochothrix thermosphacta]|uniref:Cof-type HAD-IIB family hydrolase n=1 Tax=Brochothrix thermosphacta TaxID=2756 RepID=UPI0009BD1110|nr:Cof-type HAD-IIB family hydrolase [Brochothrix thermosphacta]
MYKIIALDLDETLLNNEGQLSQVNREVLIEAQLAGNTVVLASGRPFDGMTKLAKELQLEQHNGYISAYNGGYVYNCETKEAIFANTIPVELVQEMTKEAITRDIDILTYSEGTILTRRPNEWATYEGGLVDMPVFEKEDMVEAINHPVNKMMFLAASEDLDVVEPLIKAVFADRLQVVRSKPFFLECTMKGITKGASLDVLAKSLGYTAENVIACGDSNNDESMIKYAGLGVAMANANDNIKNLASYEAPSNADDGVAAVVRKFMLKP